MPEPARSLSRWSLDPKDPRAPSAEVWAAMSDEERALVVASLPSDFEASDAMPPEGDFHDEEASRAKRGLRRFFGGVGRRVYVAGNLPVYYPGEPMFAPDLFAVVDVEPYLRPHWTVSAEGKGLNTALEIVWGGSRRKDLVENLERYARFRIPEYFIFDLPRQRLLGYRLGQRGYQPIGMRAGRLACDQLGLELGLEGERLRFYSSTAPIPDPDELICRLETTLDRAVARVGELEQQLEQERQAREQERQAREEVERKLAEALARISEFERGRGEP